MRRSWRRLTWWWPRNMYLRPWSLEWWGGYRYYRFVHRPIPPEVLAGMRAQARTQKPR